MERRYGLTETKPQRWRAVTVNGAGKEGLLILGSSYGQVQETYDDPFFSHLDEEERGQVKEIRLQKWNGTPDRGRWVTQRPLPIPDSLSLKIGAKE